MATGNGNQTQNNQMSRRTNNGNGNGNGNLNSLYKVYGTNEPYNGRVVTIGSFQYTTVGGALEGDSLQLIAATGKTSNNQQQNNSNPVTRTFVSRVTYYRQNGTAVPPGVDLHQHQDGTIMLGHNVNNMGEIVTRNNQNPNNQLMGDPGRSANLADPAFIMDLVVPENSTGGGNTNQGSGGGGSY